MEIVAGKKYFSYYILFIILYTILIASNSKYNSPHDDFIFLNAFDKGIWTGIQKSEFLSGRFDVIHGLDLFLLNQINTTGTTTLFYVFSSIIFLLSFLILFKLIQEFSPSPIIIFLLYFSTAFTSIYFRLLYQERYVYLLFLLVQFILLKEKEVYQLKSIVIILLLSIIVIFYKEPAILSVFFLGLGITTNYYVSKQSSKSNKYLGFTLMIIPVITIGIYLAFFYPYVDNRYGSNGIPFFLNFIKSLSEWILGDPSLFLIFIPLIIIRIIYIYRIREMDIYDSFAMAGLGYMLTFFLIGMAYSSHYMTPVYAFALPFVLYNQRYLKQYRFLKNLIIISILFQTGNITLGINDIVFQKFNNKNFTNVIVSLDSITKHNYNSYGKRTTFHVLGGQDQGNHFSWGALYFMKKKGNTSKMFDFISFEKITDSTYGHKNVSDVPFSFMNSDIQKEPKSGDYILFTPYTLIDVKGYQNKKYILIKHWSAPSYFGYLNFKDLIRTIAYRLKIMNNNIRDKRSFRVAEYSLYYVR